jgi:D-serine deaminase-like pyridoxal phosphate-dependent protein
LPLLNASCRILSSYKILSRAPPVLEQLETPVPIVDLDRLERNLDRAAAYAREHRLALRPHIKTHKSRRLAREQLQRGAVGVTCATPFEAEVMSDVADDILIAYPPVGAPRARRVAGLPEHVRITVALDSATAVSDLASAARDVGRDLSVYVELDLGMHRVGLPVARDAIALAQRIRSQPPLRFAGIAFYPGHIRESVDSHDAKLAALSEALGEALAQFERAGIVPEVVSGGSTPTMWRTHELSGVTEFRPGTYIFNDRTTAEIGACQWDDCALTVLATVVSTAVPGQAVIDAGSKALGREPVRASATDEGFGSLVEHPEVIVKGMSEEHGVLDLSRSAWRPQVGERVRVIPNHVCVVVHLNDVIVGVRVDAVETTWPVDARGRGYAGVESLAHR